MVPKFSIIPMSWRFMLVEDCGGWVPLKTLSFMLTSVLIVSNITWVIDLGDDAQKPFEHSNKGGLV